MMHPTTATIRLTGRDGLLTFVPTALGFHPVDSAVLVALAGPNRRVGPVVRADLPAHPTTQNASTLIAGIVHTIAPHADEAAIIVYTDHPEQLDLKTAAKPLMAQCPLMDAIVVNNTPRAVPEDLMAATIGIGRRVLASRQELAQSIEYRPHSEGHPSALADFDTIQSRDQFIQSAMGREDVVAALIAAAQATPDSDRRTADLCAALAVLAYRIGDGALTQVAIDRIFRIEPHHCLASLMLAVTALGVEPESLDQLIN